MHSIRISKPNKRIHLTLTHSLSLSLSLYVWCSSLCLSICLCLLLLHHCSRLPPEEKKKTNRINVLWVLSLYVWCSSLCLSVCLRLLLLHHCSRLPPPKKKKKPITLTCCECFVSIVSTNHIKAPPLLLHYCEYSVSIFPFFFVVSALCFLFFSGTQ